MSIVAEEFLRQRRLDRAVEEIGCNPVEYGGVAGAQHSIFECHWRIFARSSDWPYSRPGGVADGELAGKNNELRVAALVQAAIGADAGRFCGSQSDERRVADARAARRASN